MGQTLPHSVREQIIELRGVALSFSKISEQLHLPLSTVKTFYYHYLKTGRSKTNYANCGHKGQLRGSYFFYRTSIWLKRHHLSWGAPFILLRLRERYGSEGLPCSRQVQRWFNACHLNTPRQIKGSVHEKPTQAPHDEWQADAKEQLHLADGSEATYLSVVDTHSGSSLGATLFPLWPYQPSIR